MDKLKKMKHEHKLTDLLKFLIFSLIMLAPFFSIGGRMAYTIFNKNAKDSYSGVVSASYEYPLTLYEDTDYEFNKIANQPINFNANIKMTINTFASSNQALERFVSQHRLEIDEVQFLSTVTDTTQFRMYSNGVFLDYWTLNLDTSCTIDFTCNEDITLNGNAWIKSYSVIPSSLDNAFDYSISKIADEPVFNWVKNTAIYDGINAMFTGLEYDTENNPIAIMCAYWLLNTAVYIVIDIVVWAFTKMTHMFVQE